MMKIHVKSRPAAASVPRPGGWLVGLDARRVLLEVGRKLGAGGKWSMVAVRAAA